MFNFIKSFFAPNVDHIIDKFASTLNRLNAAAVYHDVKGTEARIVAAFHDGQQKRATTLADKFSQFV